MAQVVLGAIGGAIGGQTGAIIGATLTEFGCPAVDRGGNAPNLFQDPKSAEGSLPPFSTGARDDRMQRRALEAVLGRRAPIPRGSGSGCWMPGGWSGRSKSIRRRRPVRPPASTWIFWMA